jgi:hypothetical protein
MVVVHSQDQEGNQFRKGLEVDGWRETMNQPTGPS